MTYQREYLRRLRVAVIGAGSHAYRNVLPAMNFLPVDLVAVCDVDGDRARSTAAQYGVHAYSATRDLYDHESLDAVFLCVAPQSHASLACEAFLAGLHVWTEKPPALRSSEVEAMIRERGSRVAVVGYKKAFTPAADKAIELFVHGSFGPISSVSALYPGKVPRDGPHILRDGAVTDWLVNGCHPMSFLIAVAGPVAAVTVHHGKAGASACVFEFEGGALGTLHLAEGAANVTQPLERYTVFGASVNLVVEDTTRVVLRRGIPWEYGRTVSFAPPGTDNGAVVWEPQNMLSTLENKALFTQGIYSSMSHFCSCVLDGKPADRGTLEFALHLMRVYEGALLSEGLRVEIANASEQTKRFAFGGPTT
jgi:predicted dehydrogenase